MSDWNDAVDPVPRRELTPKQRLRMQAVLERRRKRGFSKEVVMAPPYYFIDPEFDDEQEA